MGRQMPFAEKENVFDGKRGILSLLLWILQVSLDTDICQCGLFRDKGFNYE